MNVCMKEFGEFGDLLIFWLVGHCHPLMAVQIPKGAGICYINIRGKKPCLIEWES